jgi:hypothetical protein
MGAVSVGVRLGLSDAAIRQIILATLINPGPTTGQAIDRALAKARSDTHTVFAPKTVKTHYHQSLFQSLLAYKDITITECMSLSPIRLSQNDVSNAKLMLAFLFRPDELLFVGGRYEATLLPTEQWIDGKRWGEHIIPNPLDGQHHELPSGHRSTRCDAAVRLWRYAVAEFDDLPIERQLAIWLNIDLPVAALIFSGGKSIHAWIYVDTPKNNFNQVVRLYREILIPLGCDPASSNPSRLSRMPGVYRTDKHAMQRLLYLQDIKSLEEKYGRGKTD